MNTPLKLKRNISVSRFFRWVTPGLLKGITFSNWLRLLQENQFDIDLEFFPRLTTITLNSMFNSLVDLYERKYYEPLFERVEVYPPIFIIGVWRSGTTFLHNLLSLDQRFAYLNHFQVRHPNTFLTTEAIMDKFPQEFFTRKRVQDDVKIDISTPDEDEIGIAVLSLRSPVLSYIFPNRRNFYYRFDTFASTSEEDIHLWKSALMYLMRKITFKYLKPIILKSPDHTGRIRLLLDIFPDAQFIFIHRDPYDIFSSTRHTFLTTSTLWRLQKPKEEDIDQIIIQRNKKIFLQFDQDFKLLKGNQFHHVSYENLIQSPMVELERIYEELGWHGFNDIQQAFQNYLNSTRDYRKNIHPVLPDELRMMIGNEWKSYAERWNYIK